MFPSLSRKPKGSKGREPSPFSSPYSNIQASPIAARRTSIEERRRPAAKFDRLLSPGPTSRIEEEEQDEEQGEDVNEEDDAGELSPLLPIFSAAHLGSFHRVLIVRNFAQWRIRCLASVQYNAHDPFARRSSMRDHPLLGPATVTPGVPVPCQTYPATDTGLSLFKGYTLRSDGQLPAIQ